MGSIRIKKNNQNYLNKIQSINPEIFAGRKNLDFSYNRVLKNILLSKVFKSTKNCNNFINKKIEFKVYKNFIKVCF